MRNAYLDFHISEKKEHGLRLFGNCETRPGMKPDVDAHTTSSPTSASIDDRELFSTTNVFLPMTHNAIAHLIDGITI